ncbi:MAG: hypothetical protein IKF72_08165 [Kiritimatiellae bacterium]|nr:hypothetical protein [Kiritimatiellia bacterium]
MKSFIAVLSVYVITGTVDAVDLSGQWHVTAKGIDANIFLPGTLGAAKLGTKWTEHDFQTTMDLPQSEALTQEYQFVGPADYVRTVELSEADCANDLELLLERVMWKSEAWLDGVSLGVRDSLSTPHVRAVPRSLLRPGKHELHLRVDNSCFYNFSRQSHAYGPNMQAVWNGVLGKIELRRAHVLRAARVFARCPAESRFEIETLAEVINITVDDLKITGWECHDGRIVVGLAEEPVYWNEFHPRLYTVRLRAKEGFEHAVRFGFKTYGTRGLAITLNGNDIFTRGNVENANFARDGVPWTDVESWRKMFAILKNEDGVNTIRFHSWTPPGAAFVAADEMGLFLQPEACIWTDNWMSDGDEVGNGKPVDAFVKREIRDIVDTYGNSPSFLSLSVGNELGNSNFVEMEKWLVDLRKYDPRPLYYCSSARTVTATDDISLSHVVPGMGMAREKLYPKTDWDYEWIYSKARVPTIAHEIGQWPVYPVWENLLKPFDGAMRPWNLSRHYDTAVARNALRFNDKYHEASAKLNRILYKEEVESFLRTPSCGGLQLLNIQDYTGQAEALVGWRGPFYDLKRGFRDLPAFSTVWGPVCHLARFEKFVWTVGETFKAKLQIRNLTDTALKAGTAYPYVLNGKRCEVRLPVDIAPGHLGDAGEIALPLVADMIGVKQEFRFGTNRWNFWVYPKEDKCAMPTGVVLTADPEVMKRAVSAGGTVLYTGPSCKSGKGKFKPVYWSARWFPVQNKALAALGTWFDVRHPALGGFTTEDFTDWQWYELAQGGLIHELVDMPENFLPIGLSVNDFHFSIFSATLFEVKVGDGRLLVCGYDLEKGDPATKRLRASLADYLAKPIADRTVAMDVRWLAKEFDVMPKKENLSGAVYDDATCWTGKAFTTTLKGFAPVSGSVRIDFHQPGNNLTSGRGLLEGRVFEVPFTVGRGQKTSVTLPIIREDMLDGKLELSVNVMTGEALSIDRIRVVPREDD